MAEKAQHVQATNDVESASVESNTKELRQKKRMKRLAYVTAFVLFLTVVILVFSLTVMRIKSPKFRIRSITIEDFTISSSNSNNVPSIDMKFEVEIGVKNMNFGHFKFEKSSISFMYRGTQVGDALVKKEKVKARSTKKINVTAEVETTNSNLANDIESGSLALTSQAKLSGKVHLLKVIKNKKSAEMNCTITVDLNEKLVRDLNCK